MKTRNIVFADFDGVLTSQLETPGSYLNHAPSEYGISPSCYSRLVDLCKRAKAGVVISSNWRRYDDQGIWSYCSLDGVQMFQNQLPKLKKMLGSLYLGDLPKDRGINKSIALVKWLEQNSGKFDGQFVVFDDDLREMFQNTFDYGINDHFILTNRKTGLVDMDIEDAIDMLMPNGDDDL